MSKLTKIERAIATIEFTLKKRKELVDSMSRKMDLNENQKIFIGDETSLAKNIEFLLVAYKDSIMQNMGKLPPQAVDLEDAVLGGLMLEKNALTSVISFLLPEHFYKEQHKEIYAAVIALNKSEEPIDMRTVISQLRKVGKLELVGGAYYITELTSKVSSAANIEFHARIMVEMAIKRGLIVLAGHILQDAYSDTSDCFEVLQDTEDHIKEINSWIKK